MTGSPTQVAWLLFMGLRPLGTVSRTRHSQGSLWETSCSPKAAIAGSDCTTGRREGAQKAGWRAGRRKPVRPRRPGDAETEGLWLACSPNRRLLPWEEEPPWMTPPSISSPLVRSLPQAPRDGGGASGLSAASTSKVRT